MARLYLSTSQNHTPNQASSFMACAIASEESNDFTGLASRGFPVQKDRVSSVAKWLQNHQVSQAPSACVAVLKTRELKWPNPVICTLSLWTSLFPFSSLGKRGKTPSWQKPPSLVSICSSCLFLGGYLQVCLLSLVITYWKEKSALSGWAVPLTPLAGSSWGDERGAAVSGAHLGAHLTPSTSPAGRQPLQPSGLLGLCHTVPRSLQVSWAVQSRLAGLPGADGQLRRFQRFCWKFGAGGPSEACCHCVLKAYKGLAINSGSERIFPEAVRASE